MPLPPSGAHLWQRLLLRSPTPIMEKSVCSFRLHSAAFQALLPTHSRPLGFMFKSCVARKMDAVPTPQNEMRASLLFGFRRSLALSYGYLLDKVASYRRREETSF